MCGIVSVFGNLEAKHDRAFKDMLILDVLRGEDSTGVAAIGRMGMLSVIKAVGTPFDLFDMASFGKVIQRPNIALIGHNRYATQGKVTKANAHPFEFETVVGVHNGTLNNKYQFDGGIDFAVDSQALYNHIDKHGIRNAIEKADGAWSLVYWDKVNSTINFIRNKERPMWLAKEEGKDVYFAASESWMIEIASARNGIKIGDPVPTEVDMLISFEINQQNASVSKPVLSKIESKVPKFVPYHQQQQTQLVHGGGATKNVLSFTPKKTEEPQGPKAVAMGQPFSKRKNVRLLVLAVCRDTYGACYLSCQDDINRHLDIRLYLNKKDTIEKYPGKWIFADIGHCYKQGTQTYYKVEYSTFKMDIASNSQVVDKEKKYPNHKGELVTQQEFMSEYSQCDWCTVPIFPEEHHRFTTMGQCLCKDCCEDKEITQYVALM